MRMLIFAVGSLHSADMGSVIVVSVVHAAYISRAKFLIRVLT
jgi:hypothetical protein